MKIAIVGISGFPYRKEASISRLKTICKALTHGGADVLCLNRHPLAGATPHDPEIPGVEVREASGSPVRERRFWVRNLRKISVFWREWQILSDCRRVHGLDAIQVYTQEFLPTVLYAAFARLHGIPLWLHYVELRSKIEERKSLFKRWNDLLLDSLALKFFDGVYPISTLLADRVRHINPRAQIRKVPPICDFREFAAVEAEPPSRPYLLYCGSLHGYAEVVDFILGCWRRLGARRAGWDLVLVLGGAPKRLEFLRGTWEGESVRIESGLEYEELVRRYKAASALLIPLRPTFQDSARFPQKIGEYLASGGLVVTTGVGEIGDHFVDGKNALVASEYSQDCYAEKLREVIQGVDPQVAIRGRTEGETVFDWRGYVDDLCRGRMAPKAEAVRSVIPRRNA